MFKSYCLFFKKIFHILKVRIRTFLTYVRTHKQRECVMEIILTQSDDGSREFGKYENQQWCQTRG